MKYILLAMVLITTSCGKQNSKSNGKNNDDSYANATIRWTGQIAVDGCDWVVTIDSSKVNYHPDVLNSSFQQDGLKVKIKFEETKANYACGMNPAAMKVIHVLDIRQ